MPACALCGKASKKRRRRCACGLLVASCCFDLYAVPPDNPNASVLGACFKCRDRDRPEDGDRAAHVARILARRRDLSRAIAMYESACSAFWDGDYTIEKLAEWGVSPSAPSVGAALENLRAAIRQACEDLGTPLETVGEPRVEFPGFCEDGSVLVEWGDLAALGVAPPDVDASASPAPRRRRRPPILPATGGQA